MHGKSFLFTVTYYTAALHKPVMATQQLHVLQMQEKTRLLRMIETKLACNPSFYMT